VELAVHLLHCHFLPHLESTRYGEITDFIILYVLLFMGVKTVISLNERMLLPPLSSFPAGSVCVVIPDVNARTEVGHASRCFPAHPSLAQWQVLHFTAISYSVLWL